MKYRFNFADCHIELTSEEYSAQKNVNITFGDSPVNLKAKILPVSDAQNKSFWLLVPESSFIKIEEKEENNA